MKYIIGGALVALSLAACGAGTAVPSAKPVSTAVPTAVPTPVPTVVLLKPTEKNVSPQQLQMLQLACTALSYANAGEWTKAQTYYLSAEYSPINAPDAASALGQLSSDSRAIAVAQATGVSTATDIAVYGSDLAGDQFLTTTCK